MPCAGHYQIILHVLGKRFATLVMDVQLYPLGATCYHQEVRIIMQFLAVYACMHVQETILQF